MADDKVALEIFIEADKAQMSLGDLEKGFDSMKERLKEVGRGSEEFKQLTTAIAGTSTEIKNIELGFEGLDRDQIASEFSGLAGGVGDVTASLVLMGGENETIEQMGASIEKAMAISMGFKGVMEGASAGMKLYNSTIKTGTLQTKIYAITSKIAAVAQKVLNAVMKANPIMLIVTAILAAVAAYKLFTAETNNATFAQKAFTEASEEAQKATVEEKIELDQLIEVAKNDTLSKKQRQAAIEELNKLAPDYLGNLTLETINTKEASAAIDGYVKSLESKARATALQNKLVEIETNLIDANNQSASEQAGWTNTLLRLRGEGNLAEETANITKAATILKLEEEKQAILGLLQAENQYTDDYVGNAEERAAADEARNKVTENFEKIQEKLNAKLSKLEADKAAAAQKAWEAGAEARAMNRAKEQQAKKDALMEDIEIADKDLTLQTERLDKNTITIEGLKSNEQILHDAKNFWHNKDLERIAEENAARREAAQIAMDLALTTLSAISDVSNAYADRDLKAEEDRFNNLRATKQLTEKQLAAEELKSAKIKDKIRKKQFENDKKMQIAMAAINGAQALTSILAQYPKFDGGFAMVAALAGSVITTAASIAKIKATTFSSTPMPALPTLDSGDGGAGGASAAAGGAAITPVSNTSTILGNQQVFVTETDITDTQNNVSVIEDSATF
jgi:hypothetical protein